MNKNQIFFLAIIQFILLFSGCFQKSSSDTVKPIIKLNGHTSTAAIIGKPYIDSGAKAIDNEDGDISSKISIAIFKENSAVPAIDTTTKGTFEIRYNVLDRAGNLSNTVIRKVIVKESFKSTYKTMYIRGTFNNWGTTPMKLIDDYHWELTNINSQKTSTTISSVCFKFDVNGDWGYNFGTSNKEGIAMQMGPDILITPETNYNFEFFDDTKKYILTKIN